jgi:predicted RND superfamily exporter protein
MTKNKKKRDKVPKECRSNFSHVETDAIRATFIENPEKAKELGKEFEASTTIKINLNEYLKTDDPVLKGCEIALQDFQPVLDDAKDEVLYIKVKPEDKTMIYHLTAHPDTLTALREISKEAKSKGFAMVDSKVHIQQAADMLKKKLAGTLKMKKGRHPKMDYLEK